MNEPPEVWRRWSALDPAERERILFAHGLRPRSRWRPYFAHGRHQLRIGVQRRVRTDGPMATRMEYRFIALEWQL